MIALAREKGVSPYVGDRREPLAGSFIVSMRARLFLHALEQGGAGGRGCTRWLRRASRCGVSPRRSAKD